MFPLIDGHNDLRWKIRTQFAVTWKLLKHCTEKLAGYTDLVFRAIHQM